MGTIEKTVEFTTDPQSLWTVVSDPSRFGEWLSLHKSWQGDPPTDLQVGTRATAVVNLAGIPSTITWTIDAYEPPARVAMSGAGPAGLQVRIGLDVAAAPAGSTLSITAAFEGQLLTGAIGTAIENAGRGELDKSMSALGDLLT